MPLSYSAYRAAFAAAFLFALACTVLTMRHVQAEPDAGAVPEDVRSILEQSLSVTEIDKEIERIEAQREQLVAAMSDKESELAEGEMRIERSRERAGEVLRAYYMGERTSLLEALLSSESWSSFFTIWDFMDIIISQDKHTLQAYIDEYRSLQSEYDALHRRQTELAAVEERLREQRDRVLALEARIAGELEGRSDADRIRLLIEELNQFWEREGLTEVRTYFGALAAAMAELPAWLQEHKEWIEIKGFNYTIRLPEDELNAFLREQDERFRHFEFRFEDGGVSARGERDGVSVSVKGRYTVEDEPVNGMMFHIDELTFNGFTLPDTTRKAVQDEFDLGFYPQLLVSFLKAKSVSVEDGELILKLSLSV